MSSSTVLTRTNADTRPASLAARIGRYVAARQSRRELEAVIAGQHGPTVREEVLERLEL